MGKDSKEDGRSVDRRTVLQSLAAGSVGITGSSQVTTAEPGEGFDQQRREMRDRFDDEKKIVGAIDEHVEALFTELQADKVLDPAVNVRPDEFVAHSTISVTVAGIDGAGITHIELTSSEHGIRVIHHLELDRTMAYDYSADSDEMYLTAESQDSVETSQCFTNDKCCQENSDCEDDYSLNQRYRKKNVVAV